MVAASGPSLTESVARKVAESGRPVIAVNDAWRRVPGAAMLYACDAAWWRHHRGAPGFAGEKWSSQGVSGSTHNDKRTEAAAFGLTLVEGRPGAGFSLDQGAIHYGDNSGFQAVNLAILLGARRIVLVGFDMHGSHFFGRHPAPLRNSSSFAGFIEHFRRAAKALPPGLEILNATPGSALDAFPKVSLDDALAYPIGGCGDHRIARAA